MTADYKQLSLFPQKAETEKETTTPADNRPPETVTWNLWHGCMAVYLYAIYIFQNIPDLGCMLLPSAELCNNTATKYRWRSLTGSERSSFSASHSLLISVPHKDGIFYKSSTSTHRKPFSIKSCAVTPAPSTSVPVNVPSYRCFTPQLGLLGCSTIRSGCSRMAISKHFAAPVRNSTSTIRPSFVVTTLSLISDGTRGVGRPPICSGQTVITSFSAISCRAFSFRLLPPLYLQFSPARQALTIIFILPFHLPPVSSSSAHPETRT